MTLENILSENLSLPKVGFTFSHQNVNNFGLLQSAKFEFIRSQNLKIKS